jgi:hypothetical protein
LFNASAKMWAERALANHNIVAIESLHIFSLARVPANHYAFAVQLTVIYLAYGYGKAIIILVHDKILC